jgi:putative ABC transport system permease protein
MRRNRRRAGRPDLWMIRLLSLIVPRRLRVEWKEEWEAELENRSARLDEWRQLNARAKRDLLRRSIGAFWDALVLQPRRLEDEMMQDLRFGARMFVKNPVVTFAAILALALGIGANTAIFSVVNGVLLRPLPYPEPERLLRVHWQQEKFEISAVTPLVFNFWAEHSQTLDVAGYEGINSGFNLAGGSEPRRVQGVKASSGFLRVLGIEPARGRSFTAEEDRPGGAPVAILSDTLWRRDFNSDPNIIGREVLLNGERLTIVGVLPSRFQFEASPDILLPLRARSIVEDDGQNTGIIARLRPGVTLAAAQAESGQLLAALRSEYPRHLKPGERGMRFGSYQSSVVGDVGHMLWLLFGAVALVLLIACANVASLLLARAASRRGEMAVRVALGASRGRLLRQLLTESWLLAISGSVVGLLLAAWGMPALLSMAPSKLPRISEVGLDSQAVLFTIGVSILTSIIFGLAPAWQATRLDLGAAINASAGRALARTGDWRMRRLLIVGEIALAIALLTGAALLLRSFVALRGVELGFDPGQMTGAQIALAGEKYRTAANVWTFEERVIARLSSLPGVAAVATASNLPLERGLRVGMNINSQSTGKSLQIRAISPDYFRVLGMKLIRGRELTSSDNSAAAPVVVVNETLARAYFPDRDPLSGEIGFQNRKHQVVGVIGDIREIGVDRPVEPTVYLTRWQATDGLTAAMNRFFPSALIARTDGKIDLTAAIRDAVREADPQLPLATLRPMTDVVSGSISAPRFTMMLMSIFAGLALVLTAIGIYGVISYQVAQRTGEIGIRLALCAQPRDVLMLVIGQGMRLTIAGIVTGILASLALTRMMANLLYGVSATDPITYISVSILAATISLAACYFPARRATRVDPLVALRNQC